MMGLAGAYNGYAEGIDAATVNPASPAVREPFSFNHIDWDLDIDGSLPGAYGGTDFDNRGENANPTLKATVNSFLYAHAGGQIQVGELGASITGEFFQYDVNPSGGQPGLTLVYGRYHGLVGYGLFQNQVVVGGGARVVTLLLKEQSTSFQSIYGGGRTLVTLNGAAPEAGAVIKPNNFPLRLGATIRAPVQASQLGAQTSGAVQYAGPFVAPAKAVLPWEIETGFALQLGPRPLNPPWLEPHAMERPVRDLIAEARARRATEHAQALARTPKNERDILKRAQDREEESLRAIEDQRLATESDRLYEIRRARENNWPRERVLLVGSLLITGSSDQAVAIEGFVNKQRELVGLKTTLEPRFGLESEPIPNILHGRIGSYLEPTRFSDGHSRQHFTFGADVKLFPFSPWGILGDQIWRLSFSMDMAPRYQNFGIGIGAWH